MTRASSGLALADPRKEHSTLTKSQSMMLVALLFAAGVWCYANRVMIAFQVADAAAHGRPRGNLSDLYPRWVGAQELLRHGRDPYSGEVTREIQEGYYGRPLEPDRPDDPRDQQGFAYPVYVVFGLAPTIGLPFAFVQRAFFWTLILLTVITTLIWLRVLRWPFGAESRAAVIVLMLGCLPEVQGLKLQQISLLVVGLIAVAMLLLTQDYLVPAGIVLALSTIKPQLVMVVLLWLGVWTLGDVRRRYRWAVSFLVTMAILLAASEWYLPHWIPRFWQAVREYQSYTGQIAVFERLVGRFPGKFLELAVFAATMGVCWRERRQAANARAFAYVTSLVLASTVLLIPSSSYYNQVLLLPAMLVLVEERNVIRLAGRGSRLLFAITVGLVLWPWVSSVALSVLSFVWPQETALHGSAVPFWTSLVAPVGVAVVILFDARHRTFAALPE